MSLFELKHHHGAVSVPNLDEAIAWYVNMLGFAVEQRVTLPQVPANVAMLKNGDLRIELFEAEGSQPAHPDRRIPDQDLKTQGNKHVSFALRELAPFVADLRERGADIVMHKEMSFASFAFVRDNSGNLIEFIQQPDLWRE